MKFNLLSIVSWMTGLMAMTMASPISSSTENVSNETSLTNLPPYCNKDNLISNRPSSPREECNQINGLYIENEDGIRYICLEKLFRVNSRKSNGFYYTDCEYDVILYKNYYYKVNQFYGCYSTIFRNDPLYFHDIANVMGVDLFDIIPVPSSNTSLTHPKHTNPPSLSTATLIERKKECNGLFYVNKARQYYLCLVPMTESNVRDIEKDYMFINRYYNNYVYYAKRYYDVSLTNITYCDSSNISLCYELLAQTMRVDMSAILPFDGVNTSGDLPDIWPPAEEDDLDFLYEIDDDDVNSKDYETTTTIPIKTTKTVRTASIKFSPSVTVLGGKSLTVYVRPPKTSRKTSSTVQPTPVETTTTFKSTKTVQSTSVKPSPIIQPTPVETITTFKSTKTVQSTSFKPSTFVSVKNGKTETFAVTVLGGKTITRTVTPTKSIQVKTSSIMTVLDDKTVSAGPVKTSNTYKPSSTIQSNPVETTTIKNN